MRARAVGLGVALALVAAAPAAAAQVEVKGLDAQRWEPAAVTIAAGDSVVWTFAGTVDLHNVSSDGENWSYQSPFGAPAPNGSFTFANQGHYRFVCAVHPGVMTGDVTVTDAAGNAPPAPPPPPPSELPFPNDSTAPGVLEVGGPDRTGPSLRAVRVRPAAAGARIRFRVSERSRVRIRFKRDGRTVTTRRVVASGTYRATVRARRALEPGRYRVEILAVDVAGNRSGVRTAHLRLR